MPIEVRLEFNSMIIDKTQISPGQTEVQPFYDALRSTIHLPLCEDDDQGGRVIVADVDLEDDILDGKLVSRAVPLKVQRNIVLGVGERYLDFIDISDRVIKSGPGTLNIAQLVIEHKPAVL